MGLMDLHFSLANDSSSGLEPILPHLHLDHCVPSYGFSCDEDYEDPYICLQDHLWRSDDNALPSLLSKACPSPCMQANTPPLTDSSLSPASSDECLSPLSSGSPLLLDGFQLSDDLKSGPVNNDSSFATVERDPQSPLPSDFPSPCLSTSSPHCPSNLLPWHGKKTAALADIHPPTPGSQEYKCRGIEEDGSGGDDDSELGYQHPMDLDLEGVDMPYADATSPSHSPVASSPSSATTAPIRSKKTSSKRRAAVSPYRAPSSPRGSSDDDAPFEPSSDRPTQRSRKPNKKARKYQCSLCSETFVRKHDLEVRHMYTKHSDQTPSVACLFCGKSLKRKDGRDRHMYTAAGCPSVLVQMRKAGILRGGEVPTVLKKDIAETWIDRDLLESFWIETDTEWIVNPADAAVPGTQRF